MPRKNPRKKPKMRPELVKKRPRKRRPTYDLKVKKPQSIAMKSCF
jgi:hypothetical protein